MEALKTKIADLEGGHARDAEGGAPDEIARLKDELAALHMAESGDGEAKGPTSAQMFDNIGTDAAPSGSFKHTVTARYHTVSDQTGKRGTATEATWTFDNGVMTGAAYPAAHPCDMLRRLCVPSQDASRGLTPS